MKKFLLVAVLFSVLFSCNKKENRQPAETDRAAEQAMNKDIEARLTTYVTETGFEINVLQGKKKKTPNPFALRDTIQNGNVILSASITGNRIGSLDSYVVNIDWKSIDSSNHSYHVGVLAYSSLDPTNPRSTDIYQHRFLPCEIPNPWWPELISSPGSTTVSYPGSRVISPGETVRYFLVVYKKYKDSSGNECVDLPVFDELILT